MTRFASRFLAAAALVAAGLCGSGSAFAQYGERPSYENEDSNGLFGGLFGGGEPRRERPAERSTRTAQVSASDLTVRLDRLENQIRQLTGTIEQLQFRNGQLEQQLKRTQEDNEFRFNELSGKTGSATPRPARAQAAPEPAPAPPAAQAAPPAAPASGRAGGRRSDAFDPDETPNAPGVPQPIGVARGSGAPPPIMEEERVGAPGGRPRGAPLDLATLSERAANDPRLEANAGGAPAGAPRSGGSDAEPRSIPGPLPPPPARNPNATAAPPQGQMAAVQPGATPRDDFTAAQTSIARKEYAAAEEALRAFLKRYPSDKLVPEAHYWLGEALYQRGRYRDAAEAFLNVSTKFESSGKAPDALLRLGQSLAALGEREAACATLGEVNRKFPRASAAVKGSVEREQARVRC